MNKNPKDILIEFLDQKAFTPVLSEPEDKYEGRDREILRDVKFRTEAEKKRYDEYRNVRELRMQFLSDVRSPVAAKLNRELERFSLPTLPSVADEFMALVEQINGRGSSGRSGRSNA